MDEARHVLALAAHVVGRHADAVAAHGAISTRYRRLPELDEPILWSYLRLGDLAAAHAFAERRGLFKNRATRERLRLAVEKPLRVEISGVIELPLTNDALSPLSRTWGDFGAWGGIGVEALLSHAFHGQR